MIKKICLPAFICLTILISGLDLNAAILKRKGFLIGLGVGGEASTWYPFLSADEDETWYGLGLFAGIGYEMSPHWMIELSGIFGIGGTDDDYDVGKNPISAMITIHWLGY